MEVEGPRDLVHHLVKEPKNMSLYFIFLHLSFSDEFSINGCGAAASAQIS